MLGMNLFCVDWVEAAALMYKGVLLFYFKNDGSFDV